MPVFLSLPGSGRGRAKQLNPLGVSVIMIQANKYKGKGIMRKLLIYLNEYRKECILAPLFKLLEASFELVVPLVVAAIIDHGIAASNKSYIFKMGGVMVLLALIGLACSITAVFKVSVYCIWCHDHGIYRGCKGSADFRRYNSTFVGCCFFRDACQYSAV